MKFIMSDIMRYMSPMKIQRGHIPDIIGRRETRIKVLANVKHITIIIYSLSRYFSPNSFLF